MMMPPENQARCGQERQGGEKKSGKEVGNKGIWVRWRRKDREKNRVREKGAM